MPEQLANEVTVQLDAAITDSATSWDVKAGEGALLPDTADGDFRARIGTELILVTDVTVDTITATRGIEGTAAVAHEADDEMTVRPTAAGMAAWLADAAPGAELDYVEKNDANVTVTATSAATADSIVSGAGFVADGASDVWVEFFAACVQSPAGNDLLVVLYEDGSVIGGSWGQHRGGSAERQPGLLRRKLTPAAGSRTYSARAWVGAGSGTVYAASGYMPAYLRVTKA